MTNVCVCIVLSNEVEKGILILFLAFHSAVTGVTANLVRLAAYDVHRIFFASAIVPVFQNSSGFVPGVLL